MKPKYAPLKTKPSLHNHLCEIKTTSISVHCASIFHIQIEAQSTLDKETPVATGTQQARWLKLD